MQKRDFYALKRKYIQDQEHEKKLILQLSKMTDGMEKVASGDFTSVTDMIRSYAAYASAYPEPEGRNTKTVVQHRFLFILHYIQISLGMSKRMGTYAFVLMRQYDILCEQLETEPQMLGLVEQMVSDLSSLSEVMGILPSSETVNRAQQYIVAHISELLSLSDIAE